MTSQLAYSVRARLSPENAAGVASLIDQVTEHDGVAPVSEHQLLRLRSDNPGRRWRHVIARAGERIVGYAIVDRHPGVSDAELLVSPDQRRRGIGGALLHAVEAVAAGRRLDIWAHGHLPAAREFSAVHRLTPVRTLWQLRRPLDATLPERPAPPTVTVRPYDPDRDAESWVALNAAAFADHPEQGTWTVDDLHAREAEPWFDPRGFLIAEAVAPLGDLRPGELAGFHWTKVHGPSTAQLDADPGLAADALGEVYVVGVSPKAQGSGLGKVLTLAGLHHLRDKGLPTVLLYVDDDNTAAMRLYADLGFTEHTVDVQYRR